MKISLIIRTLNEEANIKRCLFCIQNQFRLPDELIVVDNESTDRTLEIVTNFSNILPIKIVSNPIKGYSPGLNLGLEHAVNEIVGFLSADCFPEKQWLSSLVETMSKYDCDVVFGTELLEGENDVHFVINKTHKKAVQDSTEVFFPNTNVIYKRETLNNFLPFKGVGKRQGAEDTLLSIKYHENGLKVVKSASAIVLHTAFESMEDFKSRTYQQGEKIWILFRMHPAYPRIYLNPFYWSMIEIIYFFRYWDIRFLKVGFLRTIYTLKGILRYSH